MKTYEVILSRQSFITYTIEAESREEAELKAWHELEHDDYHKKEDASWDLESIEEQS